MKKRLLCIFVVMLMVLPMIFTSCSELTEEEIIQNILGGEDAVTALTLSVWVPTESETDSFTKADKDDDNGLTDFQERLLAVEDAINAILIKRQFSTKIKLIAVKDSEYEAKIAQRFESMGDTRGNAKAQGDKYVNTVEKYYPNPADKTTYNYEIKYPTVLDNQLDIFLVRGIDDLIHHVENNNLQELDKYVSASGSTYSNINKLIRANILSQMKFNGKTYAIPNNHLFADSYQYMLIDKAVFDSQDDYKIDDIKDVFSCAEYLNAVGNAGESGIVPLVATLSDAPGIVWLDKEMNMGTSLSSEALSNIYDNEEYNKFVSLYKDLSDKGYAKAELQDGEKSAVKFFYGTSDEAKALEDKYYIVKSTAPIANAEDVFASMFGISKYSINPDRAMKVLYLLYFDSEVRTLLQYGIEGVDYTTELDDDRVERLKIKDTAYKMNILYTGNEFYTYPGDGYAIDEWDDVKATNLDMVVNPFVRFEYYLNSSKVTSANKTLIKEYKEALATVIAETSTSVEGMSSEEYKAFLEVYKTDIDSIVSKVNNLEKNIKNLVTKIAELETQISEETDADKKANLVKTLESKKANLQKQEEALSAENAKIDELKNKSIVGFNLNQAENYKKLLKIYSDVYALCDNGEK
ncbi:MAG: hypothetical protein IJ398_00960 [Clostridia bacterium]|nr:hypothetical protein [Clostridia bacterium]